jgi:hypothetical protein
LNQFGRAESLLQAQITIIAAAVATVRGAGLKG